MLLQQAFHLKSQSDLRYYTSRHLVEHRLSGKKKEEIQEKQCVVTGAHSNDPENDEASHHSKTLYRLLFPHACSRVALDPIVV